MTTNDSVLVIKPFSRASFTLKIGVETYQPESAYIYWVHLHWESTLCVERGNIATSVIAVQGRIYRLKMFSNNIDSNNTVQIMYYWIFKRKWFKELRHPYKSQPRKVVLKKRSEKGTYLFLTYCQYREITKVIKVCEPRVWSWKQAMDICRNAGGELPQFLSRKEQEELISIIKTSTDYFFIEAVFIHLKTVNG